MKPSSDSERAAVASSWRTTAVWVLGAALLRALLAALVPLLPDESYYWLWTRHLAAGFFDHPPGVALLITLGTALFGDTTLGVRAGPAIAAITMHIAAIAGAWHLAGRGALGAVAAERVAMLVALIPIATLGLVLATPDAALFGTVMIALLAVDRALSSPVGSWPSTRWWTVAGAALGAAFVAKYTSVLLPAGLVVACLVHPALRKRFTEIGPWWASVVALALFAPVVMWNRVNDWISFRFQLGHGFSANARGSVFTRELELVGAQVGLASPILFGLMAIAVWVALRDGWSTRHHALPTDPSARRFALAVTSLVPLGFFAVSAARRPVEANWPALMYPSAMLLLATDHSTIARGRWWRYGTRLAFVLLVLVTLQAWRPWLPLPPRRDPIARAHGWSTLADAVQQARVTAPRAAGPRADSAFMWLAADRYQDASEIAFHLNDHPTVFSLNLGGRPNQFDLWSTAFEQIRSGDGLVAVFDDSPSGDSLGATVGSWFRTSRKGDRVSLKRGEGEVEVRRVWIFQDAERIPHRARVLPSLTATPAERYRSP